MCLCDIQKPVRLKVLKSPLAKLSSKTTANKQKALYSMLQHVVTEAIGHHASQNLLPTAVSNSYSEIYVVRSFSGHCFRPLSFITQVKCVMSELPRKGVMMKTAVLDKRMRVIDQMPHLSMTNTMRALTMTMSALSNGCPHTAHASYTYMPRKPRSRMLASHISGCREHMICLLKGRLTCINMLS